MIGMGLFSAFNTGVLKEELVRSRTVVLLDRHFFNEEFMAAGLKPIVDFYKRGGVVIVCSADGIFKTPEVLNEAFGSMWKLGHPKHTSICAVADGFLDAPPELYFANGVMITAPKKEFVCVPKPPYSSVDEFMEDYGIDDPMEGAKRFAEEFDLKYSPVVMHRDAGGGRLIWWGDRGQEHTLVRGLFASLSCK